MNRASIKDSIKLQPFKPFIVHTVDGQKFNIDDPDIIAISPTQEIAIIFTLNHYHVIDTTKITTLETF